MYSSIFVNVLIYVHICSSQIAFLSNFSCRSHGLIYSKLIFPQTGFTQKISCTFHYFSPAQIYSSCSPFSTLKCIIVVY